MKRIIAVFISLILLLTLCACKNNKKLNFNTATIKIGESYTDFQGVDIKIKNVIWDENNVKLEVDWINETQYEVTFGESYAIELQKDGQWVSRQKEKVLEFLSVGYSVGAGTTREKTYNLTNTFDITQEGKYRLKTHCSVGNKGVEYTKYNLWTEFYVTPKEKEIKKTSVDFNAQYIRTNSMAEISHYPLIAVIKSQEELNAYYKSNKDTFNLERRSNPSSDSTIGFLDACDKYNQDYFKDNALVLIAIEEGSGSIRHNVDNIYVDTKGKFYADITTQTPEVGTCDMAQWHIIIEIKKQNTPKSPNDIEISLDNEIITDSLYHNEPVEENDTSDIFVPVYSFSLTWNVYGISSYDSKTGKLVKTTDATNPQDYITTLKLTEQQYVRIWKLINNLNIEDYPDEYNPHKVAVSDPYMTLKLSVKTDKIDKTVTAQKIAIFYGTDNEKELKFLNTCKGIIDILTSTKEWKSLPEYEHFYD